MHFVWSYNALRKLLCLVSCSLDTFPYAGTTTTCESLYMGVPCVTMAGSVHAHNVGVSLLSKVGKKLFIILFIVNLCIFFYVFRILYYNHSISSVQCQLLNADLLDYEFILISSVSYTLEMGNRMENKSKSTTPLGRVLS